MSLLDRVVRPPDLRRLSREELHELVDDVRERHIDVVSKVGGHFAPSLGVAELTVALHYVFETPRDRLVWDTGHQAYIHKILTGRNDAFPSIRSYKGLAPFLRRDESEYDTFAAGHAATSISAALGMAQARDLKGEDHKVVAIIGDGAMTCGLAYEALNNAGHTDRDLIVILNDNEMSIAPNVGAMNKYLTGVITNPVYNRVREEIKNALRRAPKSVGHLVGNLAVKLEDTVKGVIVPGMLFEELGFRYVGPVPGHDLDSLVDTLTKVRRMDGPILVHVLTQKGKGYPLAEENPWKWHASSPWDKITGQVPRKSPGMPRYQAVFGKGLAELGALDERVVAVTAAMPDGTSTGIFGDAFPDRFFDVGIAEGHAVTSAAAMAAEGIRPVVAIYSTFLQRAYDSILHDVALQDLPVVFCLDRAGIAGEDGPTHHGIFDIAYMLSVPGMTVTAPRDGKELLGLLRSSLAHEEGPFSIRYPRDTVPEAVPALPEVDPVPYASWERVREGKRIAILAVGTMVEASMEAARRLAATGIDPTVVNCRFLKPYDREMLEELVRTHSIFLTVEEGTVVNGFGAFITREIQRLPGGREVRIDSKGIPDRYVQHGGRAQLLREIELDAEGIEAMVREIAAEEPGEERTLEARVTA